jgi:hypothetical protein
VAAAVFSPPRIRREKAGSCRMKKTRRSFAFGSSQRNRMTLMVGAARFWRPAISASRFMGFRVAPRGIGAALRRSCRTSAYTNDGFSTQRGGASRYAAQAFEAAHFFAAVGAS